MRIALASLFALSLSATTALAECPTKAPSTSKIKFEPGDQRVNAAWLQNNLAGHRILFDGWSESYHSNGEYSYKSNYGNDHAPGFKFYDNGFRCIDYKKPRFDLYVVNDGKLVMIILAGVRFEAKGIR